MRQARRLAAQRAALRVVPSACRCPHLEHPPADVQKDERPMIPKGERLISLTAFWKLRGLFDPWTAMADAPVAAMATVTAADHEQISKFCRVTIVGLGVTITHHKSALSEDVTSQTRSLPKSGTLQRYLFIDGGYSFLACLKLFRTSILFSKRFSLVCACLTVNLLTGFGSSQHWARNPAPC